MKKDVTPPCHRRLQSTVPVPNNARTMSTWPLQQAMKKGVVPLGATCSGSTRGSANNARTTCASVDDNPQHPTQSNSIQSTTVTTQQHEITNNTQLVEHAQPCDRNNEPLCVLSHMQCTMDRRPRCQCVRHREESEPRRYGRFDTPHKTVYHHSPVVW